MCVIVLQPAGQQLSGNKFRNCWTRNKDGGGYSFIHEEKLVLKKGYFDSVAMLDEYRKDLEAHPQSPFLLHFRISTSGVIDEVNSHPHWVRDDLVMAHNGHVSGYGDKTKSDTLEFIDLVLQKMPPLWEDDYIQIHLIERYIDGDKIALLRNDGDYTLLNEEDGVWKDGLWFSNNSYEKRKVYKTSSFYTPTKTNKANKDSTKDIGQAYMSQYTACGWDDDDQYLGVWDKEGFVTFLDESCAYCDLPLNEMDAEFCIELEAWYPICMECILDNEKELVTLGTVADSIEEVWDEVFKDAPNKVLLVETPVPDPQEEKGTSPATSDTFNLTANVYD